MELQDYVEKLRELEVYDQFANNLNAFRSLTVEEYIMTDDGGLDGYFRSFISCAFAWYFAPEGLKFWSKIANS